METAQSSLDKLARGSEEDLDLAAVTVLFAAALRNPLDKQEERHGR